MSTRLHTAARILGLLSLTLLALSACSPGPDYEVEIRRTSHGIPHIQAADMGSLGFGEGYAIAEDHLCTIADQIVRARSERAQFFGPGANAEHLASDLGLKALDLRGSAERDFSGLNEESQEWIRGYVEGYNLYLRNTGAENVPGWCAGEPWVREIDVVDLSSYQRIVTMTVSTSFISLIAGAQPPGETPSAAAQLGRGDRVWPEIEQASNGWGIGSEMSSSGKGMLLANPHYPWVGSNRFWEKHLTIPGDMDVYGVGLIGIPGVAIGFNDAVAWTHTVSAGKRFTIYKLDLVPGNPTAYLYDGVPREMVADTYSVEVKQADGSVVSEERTLWSSHYGPILDFPGVGWTEEVAFALRDANQLNDEGISQWTAMNRARSMDEFQEAHADYQGMPFVNTIASSAEGRAWYHDGAATPNLSPEAIELWLERTESDPLTASMQERGIVLLDGSDSTFEWVDDPEARDEGVVPYTKMPKLERRDYVFNANDSFWLANSSALMDGDYSPLHGPQNTPRTLRTRMNDTTLSGTGPDRPAGEDGKFTLDELGAAILRNRSFAAHLLLDQLVERCAGVETVEVDGSTVDIGQACRLLAEWDGRFEIDRRGAVVFREWISQYPEEALFDAGPLFAVAFDPADPVGTPNTLAEGSLALENLGRAVEVLEAAGTPIDSTLGDLQIAYRSGKEIPIHGGQGTYEGVENFIRWGANGTTLEPEARPARNEGSVFLRNGGYPVNSGSSFVMTLQYTDAGPQARAFLTYSQSGDPESEYFSDQTELFSRKAWRNCLFDEPAIASDTHSTTRLEAWRNGDGMRTQISAQAD